ncbi:MAG: hypothetical protein STHCBS139747_002278 [Sporothrix thermara]
MEMTKAYVDTPYGQVHYRYSVPKSTESTNGTVILLHKSASSSASCTKIASSLTAKGFACYAPDMPGFGSSFDPSPRTVQAIAEKGTAFYVGLYEAVFQSLGVFGADKKPVHLIGHHSGATLAVEMAAVCPSSVASVTLVGPTVMAPDVRAEMSRKNSDAFNKPVPDGSHLQKTWDYLEQTGVGDDIDMIQREAIDHIRAWQGRLQIYGAVWGQDHEMYAKAINFRSMLDA